MADQLYSEHWTQLIEGRIGLLRVPQFLSLSRRQAAIKELYRGDLFPAYDPTEECGGVDPLAHDQIRADLLAGSNPENPPVTRRLGRTLYEYSARGIAQEYFDLVDQFEAERRLLFSLGDDVIDELVGLVADVTGRPTSIAEEPGYGRYYAGVVREVHGRSRLHSDDGKEETPDFTVGALPSQLGFYIILAMPEQGGGLTVYEREFREEDAPFRQGYGLDPRAVAGESYVGLVPCAGDLIFFPDRHIHQVDACSGVGRRVMLQAHLGVTSAGKIVCWS